MRLGRAKSTDTIARSLHKTSQVSGAVGPTVVEFADIVNVLLDAQEPSISTTVVGTVVEPMLSIDSGAAALIASAPVRFPKFGFDKSVGKSGSSCQHST